MITYKNISRFILIALGLTALLAACGGGATASAPAAAYTATPTATTTRTAVTPTATPIASRKSLSAVGTIPSAASLKLTPEADGSYTMSLSAKPSACDPERQACQLRFVLYLSDRNIIAGVASRVNSQSIRLAVVNNLPVKGATIKVVLMNGYFTTDGSGFYQDVSAPEVRYFMTVQ